MDCFDLSWVALLVAMGSGDSMSSVLSKNNLSEYISFILDDINIDTDYNLVFYDETLTQNILSSMWQCLSSANNDVKAVHTLVRFPNQLMAVGEPDYANTDCQSI